MGSYSLPPGAPLWLITVAVLVPMLLTFLKGMKELSGPLGWLAKRWESRQVRAVDRMTRLDAAMEKAVDSRVELKIKPLRDRIDELQADLREEKAARECGEKENALLREYSLVAVRREFTLGQFLAERGLEMPPPRLLAFDDWVKTRKPVETVVDSEG